jgi:dipeptidyl aminopeptidase/acylaminoacyl peptidase
VKQQALPFTRRGRNAALVLFIATALGSAYAVPRAQAPAKKVLSVEDYTKWRTISGQEISGDGNWVTYGQALTNTVPTETKPVLHLVRLETNQHVEVPNGSGGIFSADSKWLAYQVDPTGGRGGRGGRGAAGGAPATEPAPGDAAVPPGAPGGPPPANPAQQTTPPGQNPPTSPTQPPAAPPVPDQQPAATPPAATPQAPAQGAPGGRGTGTTPPAVPTRVELRNLATGTVKSWQDIQSFMFSANSTHLILRRKPPTPAGGAGGRGGTGTDAPAGGAGAAGGASGTTPAGPRGTDVIVHNLITGRDQLLGSVGDIAFNKSGALLAYTVDASVKDGNGLFVIDLKTNRMHTLDNDARLYNRLTWSDDGTALAVLKGLDVEKMRERDNLLIAFSDVAAALSDLEAAPVTLDPAKASGFPKGWVVSDRAALDWSDDHKRVFFGAKSQVPAADTAARKGTDELANVDVWNTGDERVQSLQMIRAEQDRNFTFRQAFDVSAGKFVKLADETMRDLEVAPDGRWAVGRDTRGYIHDYKRAAADIYRVNTTTGERTLMMKGQLTNTSTGSHIFGISPDGNYFLYWKDNKFLAYNLESGASRTLGGTITTSFIDTEFDHPGPKPSFGLAGYTTDKKSVIVQHRYDLWEMPLDGSAARNLTNGTGTKNEMRFRYVRTEPLEPNLGSMAGGGAAQGGPGGGGGFGGGRGGGNAARATIDLSKPITLSAYGEYTKKAGFYELANGQLKELVYEDAAFSNPVKAAKADKYLFTRQTFVEFPDLRVSGPGFTDAKKISDANPQQKEYAWGRRVLFDFKNKDGVRLQGILALPDDYKPGEKRPMLVTFYEKNSQNMHRYNAPSYLTGMGGSPMEAVSKGYITMLPDVYFRTGASHSDMLECVEAATRKVIEMGYADPKRIGITGHSYGGEGAAFIGTRSRLFAAVGMGAGVTDLTFDFNQNWGWSYSVTGGSGANAFDYYLYSQGREGASPWDKPEMYRFESALTHVPLVTAPFLIMHGAADPTVPFTNGLAMYNALRYNNKKAVLLAYPGEGHGLRGMANRKDLTIRFFEFFDHYLKDAPAPKWLTDGIAYLDKDAKK